MSIAFYFLIPLKFLLLFWSSEINLPVAHAVFNSALLDFLVDLIPFILLLIYGRKLLRSEWQKIASLKKYFVNVVLGYLVIEIIVYATWSFFPSPVVGEKIINYATPSIILFSTSGLMAACVEEIGFRYLFLRDFSGRFKDWILLLTSSFIFGFLHIFLSHSFLGTIPYMLIGLVLGLQYVYHKNIWYSMGTHLLNNFMIGTLPAIVVYLIHH
ncbi:MAG TPA: CPBP family intramembrane metalloprotease [Candidatus Ligilactobacillus excrementipullorum]|nr:CPBP family intramembrane metalloprotease [Candidatus Ligilactobacillus excrementipullorum]